MNSEVSHEHGQMVSARLEIEPEKEALAKGPCFVSQRPQRRGRKRIRNQCCVWKNSDEVFFCWVEMQQVQNTLLKEKVLQEKVGISNSTMFSRSVQNRVW